jgi:hypothetical protein
LAATIQPVSRFCSFTFQPLAARILPIRCAAASGASVSDVCARWWKACRGLQVGNDLGRVAGYAKRSADDQEGQDQQKPAGAVNRIELHRHEQRGPERTELVDVIDHGLLLLQHGADHRCDADHREQGDGEAHRRHQFQRGAGGIGGGAGAKFLRNG